jgi:hypothetical protein
LCDRSKKAGQVRKKQGAFDLISLISESEPGEFINVKVIDTKEYDLITEQIWETSITGRLVMLNNEP